MCGIAGIVGELSDANRGALGRMSAAMSHRGPDGHGVWESDPDARGWGALLGHRRLAILDLSTAAAQPMVDTVTGDAIVFNGEIYNFAELRDRLVAQGETFSSTGDTAVMLRALALRGPAALPELRGMFALGWWDASRRRLLLARDPLGMKPLYVARCPDRSSGWTLAFASEVRALLASGLLRSPRLDPRAVASVIWNGFVVGPATAVSGVELLGSGTLLEVDGGGDRTAAERFWLIPRAQGPTSGEHELSVVLEEGMRQHLASDVPVAVFLSGGVDSSAVANLAQRAARTRVYTFTLAFEEQELNEAPFARSIAQAIGTEHREVVLTEPEFVAHLDTALDHLDQPTFDGLNAYFMSRAIRGAGFTVALVGTGGDELFGGYPTFRELPVLHEWSRRLRWLPRSLLVHGAALTSALLARRRGAVPPQTRWAKLAPMVERGDDLLSLYQLAYALFVPGFQGDLLTPGVTEALVDGLPAPFRQRLEAETRARSDVSAISVMELRLFLGERLLRDGDAASMAVSVEQRLPFVDTVVVDAVERLPDPLRYDPIGTKAILRRVGLRGLSPSLFDRPKRGFVLPFDRWIRRGLRSAIDETLCDADAVAAAGLRPERVRAVWRAFQEGAPGLYWSRVWALYVLVRWCQHHQIVA